MDKPVIKRKNKIWAMLSTLASMAIGAMLLSIFRPILKDSDSSIAEAVLIGFTVIELSGAIGFSLLVLSMVLEPFIDFITEIRVVLKRGRYDRRIERLHYNQKKELLISNHLKEMQKPKEDGDIIERYDLESVEPEIEGDINE